MGHKVHPLGFRIGVIRDWQAKWYADKHYAEFLKEDLKLRQAIQARYADAAVSTVEIERQANEVTINIHTARPGIVIGRGGQRVDEMRVFLEQLIGKKVQLNILEIQQPELDAYLVARTIAEQIERRVAFRRAMKQVMMRTIQAGAKGMRVSCAGRLGGAEIARRLTMHEGQVPLHTLRADIDYGFIEARTVMGRIGVKVWIYRGEVLPEIKEEELEEVPAEATAEVSDEAIAVVEAEEKPEEVPAPAEEAKEPVEAVAEARTETEEKPAKPAARRRAKAAPAEEAKEPVEAVAEASTETEEKPAKPAARRRAKAAPAEEAKEPVEAESSLETEGNDAAT